MDNMEIVTCPKCGSIRLRGEVRTYKKDYSPMGLIRSNLGVMKDLFTMGYVRSIVKAVKSDTRVFHPDKFWFCCNCGYEFPMQ